MNMSYYLWYLPYSFTSAGSSKKLAAQSKEKLLFNPATDKMSQRSVVAQQTRDAKKLKTRMAEEEITERAKKIKFDSILFLGDLSAQEYVETRKRNF
jgi:hypothetical protein